MARSALLAAAALPLMGTAPAGRLDVTFAGLRSQAGVLRVCLTTDPVRFPDCQQDPQARRVTQPANQPVLHFANLPSATYALAAIHDENDNARLDTRLGIPAEGVGFSRNPRLMFGPPRFKAAALAITSGTDTETVRMKYFL